MKGYAAYAKVKPTKEGYRDLEYKVLGTVTGALIKANEQGAELSDKFNAVLWNEKVWNAFRCDLSSPEGLPKQGRHCLHRYCGGGDC